MEYNQDLWKALVESEDEPLKKAVESAALAAGAGEKQAARLTADMNSLRRVIAGMKPSDLNAVVKAVGEDKLREILSALLPEEQK